jgi:hypothetical protein
MNRPITIMLALLIFCTVCSCSKNSEHPNEGSIVRMYKTTIKDSVYYNIYVRDANNRLISMHDSSKTSFTKYELVYGSDARLQKAVFMNVSKALFSYEFEYNTDGRIVKRKVHPGPVIIGGHNNIYVYDAAGHLTTDSLYTTVDYNTYTLSAVSKFKYTGENITEAENYFLTNGALTLVSRFKYEYDNGINPLAANEYEYYITEASDAIFAIPRKSANNVVKTYYANGNDDLKPLGIINYQYNSSKFPWKATAQNIVLNESAGVTEYFYQ